MSCFWQTQRFTYEKNPHLRGFLSPVSRPELSCGHCHVTFVLVVWVSTFALGLQSLCGFCSWFWLMSDGPVSDKNSLFSPVWRPKGWGGTKPRLLPPLAHSPFRAHWWADISGHSTLALTSGPDWRHLSSCHHWMEGIKLFFFFQRRNKTVFKSNCAAARTSGSSRIRPSLSSLTDWLTDCADSFVFVFALQRRDPTVDIVIVSLKSKRQLRTTYYCGLVKSTLDNREGKRYGGSGPYKAATFDLAGVFVILIGGASQTAVISTCLHNVASFWFLADIGRCVLSRCPITSSKRVACRWTALYFIHVFLFWSIHSFPLCTLNQEVDESAAVGLNRHTCIYSMVG